ncbi:MAG: helix-turn-helix transcriptional regulator [Undibacterium sp.]|nr:helix-turn-helix transcriptional regulator [Opitutaceae bacterium]
MQANDLSLGERAPYRSLEDVVGCKWSAAVVGAIRRGATRPRKPERYIPGISTKILNERLRRLLAYGLVARADHPAASSHVEYRLTPTGTKLAGVIEQLHALQEEHPPVIAAPTRTPRGRTTVPRPRPRPARHKRPKP